MKMQKNGYPKKFIFLKNTNQIMQELVVNREPYVISLLTNRSANSFSSLLASEFLKFENQMSDHLSVKQ